MAQTATASIACKMVASSIMLVARAGGKFVGRAGVNLIEGVEVGGVGVDHAEQERVVGPRIVAVRVVHVVHSVNVTDALTHVNVIVDDKRDPGGAGVGQRDLSFKLAPIEDWLIEDRRGTGQIFETPPVLISTNAEPLLAGAGHHGARMGVTEARPRQAIRLDRCFTKQIDRLSAQRLLRG
jgi:hypothetical protein